MRQSPGLLVSTGGSAKHQACLLGAPGGIVVKYHLDRLAKGRARQKVRRPAQSQKISFGDIAPFVSDAETIDDDAIGAALFVQARLGVVISQIRRIEEARQKRLDLQHETGPHAMVRLLTRIVGVGVETADLLVHEVLSRPMRDRRAVARYAGLAGAPDESGAQRRKQGLARAGNTRIRRGMIQLAWRFLMFQKESALAL